MRTMRMLIVAMTMLLFAFAAFGCAGAGTFAGSIPDLNSVQGLPLTEENLVGTWNMTLFSIGGGGERNVIVRITSVGDGWVRGSYFSNCQDCLMDPTRRGVEQKLSLRIEGDKLIGENKGSTLTHSEYKLLVEDNIIGETWGVRGSRSGTSTSKWRRISKDPKAPAP